MGNSQGIPANSSVPDKSQTGPAKAINYGHVDYAVLENYLRNVRSDRVRSEFLKTPEQHYTKQDEIRIWASTFNLNGRKPPDNLDFKEFLKLWERHWPIREKTEGGMDQKADLYLMGFQEVVPLTAQNVIAGWTTIPAGWDRSIDRTLNAWKTEEQLVNSPLTSHKSQDEIMDSYLSAWTGVPSANLESTVKSSLQGKNRKQTLSSSDATTKKTSSASSTSSNHGSHGLSRFKQLLKGKGTQDEAHEEFMQIVSHQLVGLYISVWARKSLVQRITGIQVTTVATGALGYLANKGAIATRMRIDDSAFVFLTSHLASGSHEGDEIKRNLDFSEIIRRTQFSREVSLVQVTKEDGTSIEDFSTRPEGLPENPAVEVKRAFVGGHWGNFRNLRELDNIIWVGDLNYRIVGSTKDVIKLIREEKLNILLEVDELNIQKANNKAFQGFKEAPIDFPPTYKYIRGTHYYTGEIDEESSDDSETEDKLEKEDSDEQLKGVSSFPVPDGLKKIVTSPRANSLSSTPSKDPEMFKAIDRLGISVRNLSLRDPNKLSIRRSSKLTRTGSDSDLAAQVDDPKKEEKKKKPPKKIRTPSWTDRILSYSSKRALHQLLYGYCPDVTISDHRPVVGTFLMQVKKFDENRVETALQEARRVIDLKEMATIPRCILSQTVVKIGNVIYRRSMEFSITIENVGEVCATYSFIPALSGGQVRRSPFPKWLSASPTSGVIKVGKKEVLKIRVSIEGGRWGSADELVGNEKSELDHILVLHIEGGSDFFISILGSYSLSCFGLSLNNLAKHLPDKKDILQRQQTMKRIVLPSIQEQAKGRTISEWYVGRSSMELTDHSCASDQDSFHFPTQRLNSSNSLSRTGPQPNLIEGPTGLMLPSQVLRMLHFIVDQNRLKTQGLFAESWKRVTKAFDEDTELLAVVSIRNALDEGVDFPSEITAHDMAGALLTFFYDLPSPMIPESIAQTCEISDVSAMLALSLVEEAMSAIEWSVFDTTMEVMRSALVADNVASNRLSFAELSGTCAQAFFQYLPKPVVHGSKEKEEIHEKASNLHSLNERRCKFMEYCLKKEIPSPAEQWIVENSDQSYRSI